MEDQLQREDSERGEGKGGRRGGEGKEERGGERGVFTCWEERMDQSRLLEQFSWTVCREL
jgi:hypothetical protein